MEDPSIIHGLDLPVRCIASLHSDDAETRFAVGTNTHRNNRLYVVQVHEDEEDTTTVPYAAEDGEFWSLECPTVSSNLVAAVCGKAHKGVVYSIPEAEPTTLDQPSGTLQSVASFDEDCTCTVWQPSTTARLCFSTANSIKLYSLENGASKLEREIETDSESHVAPAVDGDMPSSSRDISTLAWSPHHRSSTIAYAQGSAVYLVDTRDSAKDCGVLNDRHAQHIRDIDFNPNRQYTLACCGDDGGIRIWDTRNTSRPLVTSFRHRHWAWCVRYNPFHDQLVLSSGSDSKVCLSNFPSASSDLFSIDSDAGDQAQGGTRATADSDDDDDDGDNVYGEAMERLRHDGLLSVFEEHEDSVYSVAWSASDPWLFASASYSGRLVIGRVPSDLKFAFLLRAR